MKFIYIASDHAGVALKKELSVLLKKKKYRVKDLGPFTADSVDYPDFAKIAAKAVKGQPGSKGILICGTGIGMSMAANKLKGVRAALCYSLETARLSREHNDANVLCLGARLTEMKLAKKIVNTWLATEFADGERHVRRVKKIG
ncbi:MAG: ribose 5-phosphate isomerase B [Patescibacteria group bacterium]|jgi:ribose 5-phosphate isomerase B